MSKLFSEIYKKIINEKKVTIDDVDDAIENHNRVIIDYNSKGDPSNSGARVVEVYAYGLTSAGNPVIRCFQPYGQTTSRVPEWKYFRLDRITDWQVTNQKFSRPASFYYNNIGKFNPNGDESMSVVYRVAKFDDDDVFKTDTEKKIERLKQQSSNPINISDIKVGDAFKQTGNQPKTNEIKPKTNQDVHKIEKSEEEKEKELEKLRSILSKNQMTLSDLNKKMNDKTEDTPKWKQVFDKQAEEDLAQMNNKDTRNMKRRDNRWQNSSDTRYLNRKDSLNREDLDQ